MILDIVIYLEFLRVESKYKEEGGIKKKERNAISTISYYFGNGSTHT